MNALKHGGKATLENHRKVRILLSLRKEFPTGDLPAFPMDQGDDADMENINKILGMDMLSSVLAGQEA